MRTALTHLEIAEHTVERWQPAAYEFRPERKWHWLQRLCFHVLDKIGAHQLLTVTKRTYEPLNGNRPLEEALFRAIENVTTFERFEEDNLYIIMGPEQAREFLNSEEFKQTFAWRTDMKVRRNDRYGHTIREFCGVKCQVVPWIDGFAVVPYPKAAANVQA